MLAEEREQFARFKHDKHQRGWTIDEIINIFGNKKCCQSDLCRKASTPNMPYRGSSNPDILFVGVAPSIMDDRAGHCFSSQSGEMITNLCQELSIPEDKIAFSNIVKCVPWSDAYDGVRDPTEDEIGGCVHHLFEELICLD